MTIRNTSQITPSISGNQEQLDLPRILTYMLSKCIALVQFKKELTAFQSA